VTKFQLIVPFHFLPPSFISYLSNSSIKSNSSTDSTVIVMGDSDQSFDLFKDDIDDYSQSLLHKVQPPRKRRKFAFLHHRCGYFLFIQFTLIVLYNAVFFLVVDLFIDRWRATRDLVYCKIFVLSRGETG
jgi:hypothetical protein